MYNIPKELQKIIDELGGVVSIIGSEDSLNKLVQGKITYDTTEKLCGMDLDYKSFYDTESAIKFIANTKPMVNDEVYVIPMNDNTRYHLRQEDNDGENHPEYFRVPALDQSIR